jgi:hypothetical protein
MGKKWVELGWINGFFKWVGEKLGWRKKGKDQVYPKDTKLGAI